MYIIYDTTAIIGCNAHFRIVLTSGTFKPIPSNCLNTVHKQSPFWQTGYIYCMAVSMVLSTATGGRDHVGSYGRERRRVSDWRAQKCTMYQIKIAIELETCVHCATDSRVLDSWNGNLCRLIIEFKFSFPCYSACSCKKKDHGHVGR